MDCIKKRDSNEIKRNPHVVKIYTDWANHYLERGRYKRCVQDLQNDIRDGVLLADVIEAVIGVKIPNITRKPEEAEEMVSNIESCLSFLTNLGVSTQNITSKDIKEGNLKSILTLFFNLSRYKQAQKENSALAGNPPPRDNNKPKFQRPGANFTSEMPSKLPSPFKPISRESSPVGVSHIPAPMTVNASRKLNQLERNCKNGSSGTSGVVSKPLISSTSNSRPTSFIPQPKGQRDRGPNSIRPPSATSNSSQLSSAKQIPPATAKSSAGETKNTHNSMFDKFKLFNSKDKNTAKANLVSKRTSERNDPASSAIVCNESKTTSPSSSNNVRPAAKNVPKKSVTTKATVSKSSNNPGTRNEVKKTDATGTSNEKPKPQNKKIINTKKGTANEEKPKKTEVLNKPETSAVQKDSVSTKPVPATTQKEPSNSTNSLPNNSNHPSKFVPSVQTNTTIHQSKILTGQSIDLTQTKVIPSVSCQNKDPVVHQHDKLQPTAQPEKLPAQDSLPPNVFCENLENSPKDTTTAQMSSSNSHLPKPTAAVKGTSKPAKASNQDVYVPVHISPDVQSETKLTKARAETISVAMVSPILNSTNSDNLKLETTASTNKLNETNYADEADDIVVNIKPMQPIIRSSAYGYMRSLGPLAGRLRFQTELNSAKIGYSRQILSDANRIYSNKKSLMGTGSLFDGDYLSDLDSVDLSAGYMSDGDILRPGTVCHLDDIASGYLSEGGSQPLYVRRNVIRNKESFIGGSQSSASSVIDEKHRSSLVYPARYGFEDSSSLSSGISDTVTEFSTDDVTSSSMSSDNNQFNSLKRSPHTSACKFSLPSSSEKSSTGAKSNNSTNDTSKSRSNVKKTDSSMQTESSAFHHTSSSAMWKKHHDQPTRSDNACELDKCKSESESSKGKEKKSTNSVAPSNKKSNVTSDSHKSSRHKSSKDDSKHKGTTEVESMNEKVLRPNKNPCNNEPSHSIRNNDTKKALPSRAATPNATHPVSKRSNAVHINSSCGNMKSNNNNKLSVGNSSTKKILEKHSDNNKGCDLADIAIEQSQAVMFQRCGTVPGCSSSRNALDLKGKLKVCANTQTTVHDLCVAAHSDSEYSSLGRKYPTKHYLLSSPISLKERIYSNRTMTNGSSNLVSDYVMLPGLSSNHEHRPRFSMKSTDSDNYLRLDIPPTTNTTTSSHYAWLRHSPSLAMSVASAPSSRLYSAGVLTEAESMESLSSTTSSVHAQIQHARANSLTHARLMMHQRELSASPRLSRSNSIRSTKSEKLYPSMLQRSDDADSAIGCSTSLSGYSANGSNSSHTSQPTSPISLTQGCARLFPLSHMNPTSNTSQTNGRTNSMSHYMGGLLSKINNKDDEMHGSALSLVSTTSSLYSTHEEKQAHEIKKLKRELDQAHDKVSTLTSQLSTNAHMVAAFEQSLSNMTTRLQHLTATAEQKDSELSELRSTIEALKKQSAEAGLTKMALQSMQAVQRSTGVPNLIRRHTFNTTKDTALQEHRISRQFSTESMSSANSLSSTTSMKVAESMKKKKKKSWFKSSFSRAFSRSKKNKNGSVSDVEDMRQFQSDSSTPNSPLLNSTHLTNGNFAQSMKLSHSSSAIYDKDDEGTPEIVTELKKQLREKDLVLTDIRLEALTSAHHLEGLKDTVNKMKMEMINLKQDNDRLHHIVATKSLSSSQCSLIMGNSSENLEKRLSGHAETPTVGKNTGPNFLDYSDDNYPSVAEYVVPNEVENICSGIAEAEWRTKHTRESHYMVQVVKCNDRNCCSPSRNLQSKDNIDGKKIMVSVYLGCHGDHAKCNNQVKETFIGSIFVNNKTKWDHLDNLIKQIFKDYIFRLDPVASLGLSSESILSYHIGDVIRSKDSDLPELLPCGYFVGDNAQVQIVLKGTKQNAIDALSFEILIPKSIVHRYVSLLCDHRRIILCGPSGTGKTYIAQKLADYLIFRNGKEEIPGAIATFSVDHKSAKELRQYLSNIAEQCESSNASDLPSVIILDNLHHVGSLAEVFNGFLSAKYQKCPYIIGTMNQATCSTTNLQLHHNFRWVLCANHMEPVKGFLGRYLRKKLVEEEIKKGKSNQDLIKIIEWMPKVWQNLNKFLEAHSSSDVTIGPRLFLSCPIDISSSQVWFTDLWNYSIIPYLLEAVREGLQLYGRRAPWEDPADWVYSSYPWPTPSVGEWPQLLRLRQEDVGYDGHPGPGHNTKHVHSSTNEVDGDPLLNMLMRLQEAASYSSPLASDNECSRLDNKLHNEELITSDLESTL